MKKKTVNVRETAPVTPNKEKVCTGRDLAAALASIELPQSEAKAWHRDLIATRKALAQDAQTRREERMRFGEAQLRQTSAERGLDWDRMSEGERETFVDDLLHEK